jgi:two-component system, chemotaxis family, chemotaxis protein CheY
MLPLILIVDDDSLLRTMVQDALAAIPCRISQAKSGDEALAAMAQENAAVMLLDLVMPKKSGLEVLNTLKGLAAKTKVIVLSSIDTESLMQQALNAGAYGFIVKPFHPLDIQNVVRGALEVWGREA